MSFLVPIPTNSNVSFRFEHQNRPKPEIAAKLTGSDQCEALGIVAKGYAPALVLCRELLAAGINPNSALVVYRNGILAFRIRSIGEGDRLTVKTAGNGTPIFALDDAREGAAGPPMRKNRRLSA